MAALDLYHDAVKNALIKDGWTITDDPLRLSYGGEDVYVDLGAEKIIAAEKNGQKIAIEIKSFLGHSEVKDLHDALGQYIMYRDIMLANAMERTLYLPCPRQHSRAFLIHHLDAFLWNRKK